jgi:hypothetical protein
MVNTSDFLIPCGTKEERDTSLSRLLKNREKKFPLVFRDFLAVEVDAPLTASAALVLPGVSGAKTGG